MRMLCVGLVLALLLSACGGKEPEGEKPVSQIEGNQLENSGKAAEKQACFAKITVIADRMVAANDAFVAATGQAANAEQFAAGMQALAKATVAGWADLQKLNDELNVVGAVQADVDKLLAEPLGEAVERRTAALETGIKKWAAADGVEAAFEALMQADPE